MAEMLISLHSSNPSGYGTVLSIQEDKFSWGAKEIAPNFGIIKFPDVAPSSLIKYTELRDVPSGVKLDKNASLGRYKWQIEVSGLSPALKNIIDGVGLPKGGRGELVVDDDLLVADVSWTTIRANIKDRVDNETEADKGTEKPTKKTKEIKGSVKSSASRSRLDSGRR